MSRATVLINGIPHPADCGTLLSDLLPLHRAMDLPCGGRGTCGKCRVTVSGNVSPPTDSERNALGSSLEAGVRLACQTRVTGNCTVIFREDEPLHVRLGSRTALSHDAPLFHRFGVAIDIGTTTLAAQLYDKHGVLLAESGARNPQIRYGADVMTRMDASLHGNGEALTQTIRTALSDLIRSLAEDAGITPADIDGAVITGNTAMLHFLTGASVLPLSRAPFLPDRLFGELVTAADCGISALSPDTTVYLPPCLSAFVGADSVTALLYAERDGIQPNTLLTDVGTNGEILLRTDHTLYACSTAAGPAFEGAGISCGMMGRAGAIHRVTLVNGSLHVTTIDGASPVGICGSGLLDAVACLLLMEELDETGYLEEDPIRLTDKIALTQEDIRNVQLAKGAVHAGITTLLRIAELPPDEIRQFWLAGGFGSYLNLASAKKVGLIPPIPDNRIAVIGNAALNGAALLLLNRERMADAEAIARTAVPVELSANPIFTEEFVKGMLF